MKKFINAPDAMVADALAGIAAAHPELRVDRQNRVIFRAEGIRPGKVAVISGGGSGHEPLHGGFVGTGMLDAACAGAIFTSPTPDQILAATEALCVGRAGEASPNAGAGALYIVKNYTGDVMNFEMAAELAEAEVRTVLVADDVAVEDSTFTAGRRGTGATVLLEKIVGAAAEEGQDLDRVAALATRVAASARSMGVALAAGWVPGTGMPGFVLGDDEMEIGIGIHGEPGRHRAPLGPAAEIAARLVEPILADYDFRGAPAIVLVNGMGATPLLELYLMYGEVARLLEDAGVPVARRLVGNYITSLDMAGCSLTLLRADAELLRLWDAPVSTPALRWGI